MEESTILMIAIGLGVLFLLWLLFLVIPVGLWFTAHVSGVDISLLQLVLMKWRKVPPAVIVNNMISAAKAGIKLERDDLEAHYLAGGQVNAVVKALIMADKANIPLDFKTASAIDLSGRDVVKVAQMAVNTKGIITL